MTRSSYWAIAGMALVVGATLATTLSAVAAGRGAGGLVRAPAGLEVTNPRICAAEAVYRLASADDFGLRAAIAQATINGYRAAGAVPNCAAGVTDALSRDFSPARWQLALDAVDAVMSGDYSVSPGACARATAVVPLATVRPAPAAPRAQCVIYNLAFVEVRP
ncbi:hypothetical protein [[Pseudomonas] boreopolis]|uniref:Uncharacterized protein n=1 Tax=Xanthomonas boreopolis TaxID=86183 RepID=A0A919KHH8_9XANT|nr:hypothetical protein GCM10009090_16250 [[Pseudomonas] boreopolis]